jgi:hypothetical protein
MIAKSLLSLLAALAIALLYSPADAIPAFTLTGTGSLTTIQLTPTFQHETITVDFAPTPTIDLDKGVLQADFDLTKLPDIIAGLSNTVFAVTSASGNAISGVYDLTTTNFVTPLDEFITGVFQVTSASGLYSGMTGSGTFSGETKYDDLTLATGGVTFLIEGTLQVPEPSTLVLFASGALILATLGRRRMRS